MPTILRDGPYRLDGEPVHIHVARGRATAKFWLQPVALVRSNRFAAHELGKIESLVRHHENRLAEAWHDYFQR